MNISLSLGTVLEMLTVAVVYFEVKVFSLIASISVMKLSSKVRVRMVMTGRAQSCCRTLISFQLSGVDEMSTEREHRTSFALTHLHHPSVGCHSSPLSRLVYSKS